MTNTILSIQEAEYKPGEGILKLYLFVDDEPVIKSTTSTRRLAQRAVYLLMRRPGFDHPDFIWAGDCYHLTGSGQEGYVYVDVRRNKTVFGRYSAMKEIIKLRKLVEDKLNDDSRNDHDTEHDAESLRSPRV